MASYFDDVPDAPKEEGGYFDDVPDAVTPEDTATYQGPGKRALEGFERGYSAADITGNAVKQFSDYFKPAPTKESFQEPSQPGWAESHPTAARIAQGLIDWSPIGLANRALATVPAAVNAGAGWLAGTAERNPNAVYQIPRYDVPLPRWMGGEMNVGGLNSAEANRLQRDLELAGQGVLIEPGMGLAGQAAAARANSQLAKGARALPEPTTPEEMAAFNQRAQETAPPPPPPREPPPSQEPPLRPGERGPTWQAEQEGFMRWREAYDAGQTPNEMWGPPPNKETMGFGEIRSENGRWNTYTSGAQDGAFATRQEAADALNSKGFVEPRPPRGAPEAEPGPQPGQAEQAGQAEQPRQGRQEPPPPPQAETWTPPPGSTMGPAEVRFENGMYNVYFNDVLDNSFGSRGDAASYLNSFDYQPGPRPQPEPPPRQEAPKQEAPPPPPPPPEEPPAAAAFTTPRAAPRPPPRPPEPPPRAPPPEVARPAEPPPVAERPAPPPEQARPAEPPRAAEEPPVARPEPTPEPPRAPPETSYFEDVPPAAREEPLRPVDEDVRRAMEEPAAEPPPERPIPREAEVSKREAEMLREAEARPEPPPEPPRPPIPPENYSVRDMLDAKERSELGVRVTRRRTPEQTELADLLARAETRSLELSKLINDAGLKVREVNSFSARDLPEVRKAREELSSLGGATSRLLAGLKPRKGRDAAERLAGDIQQLREVLGETAEPAPQPRPQAAKAPKPEKRQSLLEFIAMNGGISPKDPMIADLRSVLGRKNALVPRYGAVIRESGRPLDRALENAVEAGYIEDPGWNQPNVPRTSTIRDLLDAIAEERAGRKVYPRGEEVARPQAQAENQKKVDRNVKQILGELEEGGLTKADIDMESVQDAARAALDSNAGLVDLYEQAVMARADRDAQQARAGGEGEGAGGPREQAARPGDEAAPPVEGEAGEGAGPVREARRAGEIDTPAPEPLKAKDDSRKSDQRQEFEKAQQDYRAKRIGDEEYLAAREKYNAFTEELGADNKPQTVMPGAERDVAGMAQRRAEAPLKPKTAQKPADEGLFGDEAAQEDFLAPRKKGAIRREGERDRSGRPTKTKPIPIGSEEAILEKGYEKATGPKLPPDEMPPEKQAMLRDAENEIVADQLELRNRPKLAAVSRAVGGGRLNPTELRVKVQDKFLRIRRLEDQWKKDNPGVPFPENWSTYTMESLYYGKTGRRLEDFDKHRLDPLLKEMAKRDVSMQELDEYLYARHAPERNRELRKINPSIANPSGMSDTEAADILRKYNNRLADLAPLERRVRQIVSDTMDGWVRDELITPESASSMEKKYSWYVPLRGHDSVVEGVSHGKAYSVRGPESRQALGRRSKADSPLQYVISQAQQGIIRGERNRVGQTAYEFFNNNSQPDVWKVDKAPMKRRLNDKTGLVEDYADPTWLLKDDPKVFHLKIEGVPHRIRFEGEYGAKLARALNSIGSVNMPGALQVVSLITRTMARLSTTFNPEFMMSNFMRDAGEAFINLGGGQPKGFRRDFGKGIMPAIGGVLQAVRGKTGGKWAQIYREYEKAGGKINFFGMDVPEEIGASVEKRLRQLNAPLPVRALRASGRKLLNAIDIANTAIENGTRVAAYAAARKHGISPQASASLARELTVNFNRKGELGSLISAGYMFANAGIQGQMRMAQAMRHRGVRRAVAALATITGILTLYNIATSERDKDGKLKYSKIPSWERDGNLIFMDPDGKGAYTKIPLPFGYSFFKVAVDHLTAALMGEEEWGTATKATLWAVLHAFDPLGQDQGWTHFVPTPLKPVAQLNITNRDAFDRPINPDREFYNKHKPDSSMAFRSASPWAKNIAQGLNELTGGTKDKPGWLDIGPGSIDFTVRAITGGFGGFMMNTADSLSRLYQGRDLEGNKIPFARRFRGEVDSYRAESAAYFKEREAVQAAEQQKQTSSPEFGAASTFKSAEKARKDIVNQIDSVKNNARLTERQKDEQVKQLQKQQTDLMFNARQVLERNRARIEKRKPTFQDGGYVDSDYEEAPSKDIATQKPQQQAQQKTQAGPKDYVQPQPKVNPGQGVTEQAPAHDPTTSNIWTQPRRGGYYVVPPDAKLNAKGQRMGEWRYSPQEVSKPQETPWIRNIPQQRAYMPPTQELTPEQRDAILMRDYTNSVQSPLHYPVYADGGLVGKSGEIGDAAGLFANNRTIDAIEQMHQRRKQAQGIDQPEPPKEQQQTVLFPKGGLGR